jgi:hypothetical protein
MFMLRSELVLLRFDIGLPADLCEKVGGVVGSTKDGEKSEKDTVCGVLDATSLPCLCFGGGGFGFFFSASKGSPIKLVWSSSSDAAISYDVRGVSLCDSCIGSNIDCRDIEDVSVLSLLSTLIPAILGFWGTANAPEPDGFALPVMRSLVNASTSIDALYAPWCVFSGVDRSNGASRYGAGFTEGSIVASVF